MTAQRKLQLVIEVVTKQQKAISKLIAQLNELNAAAKGAGKIGGDTKEVDALVAQLEVAKKELESIRETLRKGVNSGLADAADKAGKASESLGEMADSAKSAKKALGDQSMGKGLEKAQDAAISLSDELSDIQDALNRRKNVLEINIEEAKRKLIELQGRKESLADKKISLELNASELQTQLKTIQTQKDELSAELIELKADPDAATKDIDKLEAKLEKLSGKEVRVDLRINKNKRDFKSLEDQVDSLTDREVKINANIDGATQDLKEFDKAVTDLSVGIAKKKFTPDDLKRFKETLQLTEEQLSQLSNKADKGGKLTAQSVTAIATSFLAVQSAIQVAFGLAQTFYSKTIGLSEQLNAQLLKNAANIAATSKVEVGGNLVEGVEAIKALQPELKAALQELEIRTEKIAGVTDEQVRTAFDAVISRVGMLNGQSQQFNNSIEASTELAAKLTAALSANNLADTTQIYQEIGDLITGEITEDSQLARALNIDRSTVQRWQQQGVLVDELINRLGGFETAANLAANSISNVSSNFISLTERISRESTADLLDPIANGLLEVFNLVSENEDEIVAEIKVVLDALSGIAMEIGQILSPLGELGDEADTMLALVLDGFQGIERILQILGPVIQATLGNLVGHIESVVAGVESLRIGLNGVLGGLRNVNEALGSYAEAGAIAAAESQRLADSIAGAGEKSEAVQRLYKEQAAAVIESNKAQIASLRELAATPGKQREEAQRQIEALQGWNTKLTESKETLSNVGEGLKVLARDLPDIADTFEEVADRTDNALKKLAEGSDGKLENVGRNIKQLTEGVKQLFDGGELSSDDAISRLAQALKAPGLELEQKIGLAAEIRKLEKTASQEKISDIETELKVLESGLSKEEQSTADAIGRTSALREKALQARIEQTATAIKTEQDLLAQDAGSERTLKELQNQQKQLNAELESLGRESARSIRDAQVGERKAALDAEMALVQSSIDQEEFATAESITKLGELREQALRDQIEAQQALVKELTDSNASQAAITQAKAQAKVLQGELKALAVKGQREIEDARIAEVDRANVEIKELASKTRRTIFQEEQALLQERGRNAELTEQQVQARIGQLQADANRDRISQEMALQAQRVAIYEEGTLRRRQAEVALAELQQQLLDANAAAVMANREAQVAAIDTQIQDEQRLQELQQSRLRLQQEAEQRVLGSLQQQRDLFESQIGLINERNQLAQSLAGSETADAERALQIRKELAANENLTSAQRKQLEKELTNLGFSRSANERKIADEILKRKKEEIQLRAQALESQQAAERAQLEFQNQLRALEAQRETRQEQSQLRQIKFQQTLLELEVSKAQARGDARGAELAQDGVDRADEDIVQQQRAIAQSQQAQQAVAQLNQDATDSLAAKQARESFEFARGVARESQQLATELGQVNEKVGKKAQRFANQQDNVADGAQAEAEQTLLQLQELRTGSVIEQLQASQQQAEANIDLINAGTEYASVLGGQLTIETQLADEAERRLAATEALANALGKAPRASTDTIPSLDTGGPLSAGQTTMIHGGELIVPGAPNRSAAINAIATGRSVKAVRNDGLYKGPGGYVLNRQTVNSLVSSPSTVPAIGTGAMDIQELAQQTGLLGQLVEMTKKGQVGSAARARADRHKRYSS